MGNFITRTADIGQKFGEYGFWRAQGLLCSIIHMLLNAELVDGEDYMIQHGDRLVQVSDFVREVEFFLRNNLARKITLEEVAAAMHVSASALSHRFKRERGETPIALQHRMRINYAGELVMKGYPLKEVAEELGYSDEFHLSKMFKKITGKSPRAYRKALRSNTPII
jgi:AraC-like DNA-binding protein